MNEKELREKVANEIKGDLIIALENCACLGRDSYGEYIDRLVKGITKKIKKEE